MRSESSRSSRAWYEWETTANTPRRPRYTTTMTTSSLTTATTNLSVPCLVLRETDRRGVAGRDGPTAVDGRAAELLCCQERLTIDGVGRVGAVKYFGKCAGLCRGQHDWDSKRILLMWALCTERESPVASAAAFNSRRANSNPHSATRARRKRACCASSRQRASAVAALLHTSANLPRTRPTPARGTTALHRTREPFASAAAF